MKNKSLSNFFAFLSSVWIAALIIDQPTEKLKIEKTQQTINTAVQTAKAFQSKYQRLPHSISEIRNFAHSQKKQFSPYDAWGTRLDYRVFNHKNFYVKSFGPLMTEGNIVNDQTITFTHFQDKLNDAIEINQKKLRFPIYPAVILEGIKSPDTKLVAQLEIDRFSQQKVLVVRSLDRQNFVISSFHDRVNEFLWLQNSEEIVFTAEKTDRYSQGIYLWNLKTGLTENLLKDLKNTNLNIKSDLLAITLSTTYETDRLSIIHFHAAQSDYDYGLSPTHLFSPSNRYRLIRHKSAKKKQWLINRLKVIDRQIHWSSNRATRFMSMRGGYTRQKVWNSLPFGGQIEETIDSWQKFSAESTESPLFPYSLWWLCSIYWDSFARIKQTNQSEAFVLRNFGIEISQVLEEMQVAPVHLRQMAKYIKISLINEKLPTRRLFKLEK